MLCTAGWPGQRLPVLQPLFCNFLYIPVRRCVSSPHKCPCDVHQQRGADQRPAYVKGFAFLFSLLSPFRAAFKVDTAPSVMRPGRRKSPVKVAPPPPRADLLSSAKKGNGERQPTALESCHTNFPTTLKAPAVLEPS